MKRLKPSEHGDRIRAAKVLGPENPALPGYPIIDKNSRFARKLWQRMVSRYFATPGRNPGNPGGAE